MLNPHEEEPKLLCETIRCKNLLENGTLLEKLCNNLLLKWTIFLICFLSKSIPGYNGKLQKLENLVWDGNYKCHRLVVGRSYAFIFQTTLSVITITILQPTQQVFFSLNNEYYCLRNILHTHTKVSNYNQNIGLLDTEPFGKVNIHSTLSRNI